MIKLLLIFVIHRSLSLLLIYVRIVAIIIIVITVFIVSIIIHIFNINDAIITVTANTVNSVCNINTNTCYVANKNTQYIINLNFCISFYMKLVKVINNCFVIGLY